MMKKRLLSMLLVMIVAFSFSTTVFADDPGGIRPRPFSGIEIPYPDPIEIPCDETDE